MELRDRIAGLLDQLQGLANPSGPAGELLSAMSETDEDHNIGQVKEGIRILARTVEELQAQLEEALTLAENLESLQGRTPAGSGASWLSMEQSLQEASGRSRESYLKVWLMYFAGALSNWNLEVCQGMRVSPRMGSATWRKRFRKPLKRFFRMSTPGLSTV